LKVNKQLEETRLTRCKFLLDYSCF